jgi:sugar fermentation stimulation protein A
MRLPPLVGGHITKRYQRFLADVVLDDGSLVTAHCPNTGTMATCWEPGAPVQLSFSDNPKRKYPWTLERIDMGGGWIGVNTLRTNGVIAEAVAEARIPELSGYHRLRREVRFEASGVASGRLDLLLEEGTRSDALVEVKNVTLLDGQRLRFPDAVSVRGRKHLELLLAAVHRGLRGVVLFAANRPEGECFSPASGIDPGYARRLQEVAAAGVEVLAVRIRHTRDGLEAGGSVPVDLDG